METRRDLRRRYWVRGLPRKHRVKEQGENSCGGRGLAVGGTPRSGEEHRAGVGLRLT